MKKQLINISSQNSSISSRVKITKSNLNTVSKVTSEFELPPVFRQLVVFVLDGSGSMTFNGKSGRSKGDEVSEGVTGVIDRLMKSKNRNSFDISMYAYAEDHNNFIVQSSLKEIQERTFNPCDYITDHTGSCLKETLSRVETECLAYLSRYSDNISKTLVIILSDGAIHDYLDSLEITKRLKTVTNIDIATVFYESTSGLDGMGLEDISSIKTNMQKMASRIDMAWSAVNPEDVRKQMIKSISLTSKID